VNFNKLVVANTVTKFSFFVEKEYSLQHS